MSNDWQKLAGKVWYRKRDIYTALWSDEPDRLYHSVVAGAPYGGPVATVRNEHVFQPIRGSLKPELQTWTSSGRLIASTPWAHTGLLAMAWSGQETLVCVFENGVVRTFTVLCEQLHVFTLDERIKGEGGATRATIWDTGIAVITRKHNLYINTSVTRADCHRSADMKLKAAPLSLCALPPPFPESSDVQIIVGTEEGPVLLSDRNEVKDIGLDKGPYQAFSVSASGSYLACLSKTGVFKVLSVRDLVEQDEASIEQQTKPTQMVWCGDDCIALYFAKETPSRTVQHSVFLGGPQNDWILYLYDSPLHLVAECDGLRILGAHKVEFAQKVPESTEVIFSIGNCDPPAMLCYALERYEKGDVCAQESLRLDIKDDLADAVQTCVDAAKYEHDPQVFQALLRAAVFGRHFLPEQVAREDFIRTCRGLRICHELRKAPMDIPMSVSQLERLGIAGLVLRLAQRRHHFLAVRICEWVGHPREKVMLNWACEKIRTAKGALTDEQLCKVILAKFASCPGIGYAEVARVAAEQYRPHLATMLLDKEPRGQAQVQVLLQLSREGEPENRQMMLRIAVEKAVQSGDPDLVYSALSAICGADPCGRAADVLAVATMVKDTMVPVAKEKHQEPPPLLVVADVCAAALVKNEQFDKARSLHEALGRSRLAAQCAVMQAFKKSESTDRGQYLRFAKDFFGQTDPQAPEVEKLAMAFCGQACTEEADLLRAQVDLTTQSELKRWPGGPHKFAGLPLVTTLCKLIELEEIPLADKLRTDLKVSDKRYWRVKVRALAECRNWQELHTFGMNRTSPIGYEPFIEAFLRYEKKELALPFVQKLKSPETQAMFYDKMGMAAEAQAARASQGQGAGRLFQNFLRMSGAGSST